MMIEFTAQDGTRIAVNPAAIWHIRIASGDQTAIYAPTGAAVFVMESYAEVLRRVGQMASNLTEPRK